MRLDCSFEISSSYLLRGRTWANSTALHRMHRMLIASHCRGLDGLLRSCKGLRCCCTSWPEMLNSSANQTTRYHKVHQDLFILFNINMVQADCTNFSCCDEWRHLSTKVLVQSAIRSFPTLWVRTTARGPTYKRTLGLMIDWCIFKLRGSVHAHTHTYIII